MRKLFTSWRTTLAGVVAVASYVLPFFGVPIPPDVTQGVLAVATGVGLMSARDNKVSSEQAGAPTNPPSNG